MEKHLITLLIMTQVQPDQNAVIRLAERVHKGESRAVLVGRKGSWHEVNVAFLVKVPNEQLMAAAREGLIYEQTSVQHAFSPDLDASTGLPVLMERYDHAFAKRQLSGKVPMEAQMTMNTNQAAEATTSTK